MLALPLWLAAWMSPLPQVADDAPAPKQGETLGARAKFSREQFDFGTVLAGTAISAEMTIENVGDQRLSIRRVGIDCGCATLKLSTPTRLNVPIDPRDHCSVTLDLEPGETATLKVTLDSSKLPTGPLEKKKLLLVCNDAKEGTRNFTMTATIERPKPAAPESAEGAEEGAGEGDGGAHRPAEETPKRETPAFDPATAPRLEVDTKEVDFGTVFRGEKLHRSFTLKNSGKSDLVLQEIRNSCACAASKLTIDGRTLEEAEIKESKRLGVLSPGEEAQLDVELKTAAATTPGKEAELTKAIGITSNDPTGRLTITMRARMISPFTVEPASFDFGVLPKGKGGHLSATVWSDQLGDFPITGATSPNPELLTVAVRKAEPKEGQPPTWSVDVEISPAAPIGSFASHVELQVAHERVKEIILPIHLTVQPNVLFTDNKPDSNELLDFETMTRGTAKTIELTVENGDPAVPYEPTEVKLSAKPTTEGFTVERIEIEKGRKYVIKVTAPPAIGTGTYFHGDITLLADHPDLPLKKVRFRGWYQDAEQAKRKQQ